MKITKKLLERHGLGLCSEEERKAIERWFETLDDPSLDLKTDSTPEFDKEYTWSKMTQDLPELENRMSLGKAKRIQLFKDSMRYAAAACFVIGIFFFGRISVTNVSATEIIDKSPKDILYVYGENGSYAQMDGGKYNVQFDGKLKLYNDSDEPKVILCGAKKFEMEPFKTYLLY